MGEKPSTMLVGWREIAAYLNCSLSSARRRVDDGIPVFRVGGSVRAYREEIDRWMRAERSKKAEPPAEPESPHAVVEGLAVGEILSSVTVQRGERRFAVVPLGVDDDEFKEVVARLEATEEKYRQILETVPAWIWGIDVRGEYVYSNAAVLDVLGYRPEEVIGRKFLELGILPEDLPQWERSLQALKEERKPIRYLECRFVGRGGTRRWLETDAEAVFDAAGNFAGVRGVSRDVTERRLKGDGDPEDGGPAAKARR